MYLVNKLVALRETDSGGGEKQKDEDVWVSGL